MHAQEERVNSPRKDHVLQPEWKPLTFLVVRQHRHTGLCKLYWPFRYIPNLNLNAMIKIKQ